MQQLAGFYNSMRGKFDSWLYQDADDNNIVAQVIGTGDGVTTSFQLVRAFGGFTEPILAPNVVSNIYLNGVNFTQPGNWNVGAWNSAVPGVVVFNTPPANGVVITATFSYYFPCRFDVDEIQFNNFLKGYYKTNKIQFITLKN